MHARIHGKETVVVRIRIAAAFLASVPFALHADPPSGYYDSADGLTGGYLRDALHDIVKDHVRYPYTSGSTDTWDILSDADEDPSNASNVLNVYKNNSVPSANTATDWNREHTWPKSYGFPNDVVCNYPYTDCHHLMAANPSYNSARNNRYYDMCASGCTEYDTIDSSSSNWGAGDVWEVWDGNKGDIARAMFYMDVRYEGGTHGGTSCAEPDLILTDTVSLIQTTSTNDSVGYMGKLTTLLEWHLSDPVDDDERTRNDVVYGYQGNRNPFIDHPEWVCDLYGITGCVLNPWINEIHYDNTGTDTGEGVEIAGQAGMSLGGWSLVAYNGSGGASYDSISLSGTIDDEENGFGAVWFSFPGLQNGAPDGVALVDDDGELVQFLSYEGSFTASGGAADGATSEDIGVGESGSDAVGHTLQLSGTGTAYEDFTWESAAAGTTGSLNNDQSFGDPPSSVVVSFTSVASEDGWVLENTETASAGGSNSSTGTVITVGDDSSDRAYRGVLSFDTSSLPDTATITRATVKLTRTSVAGTAFASLSNCVLDIAAPLGGSTALADGDWEASVGASACATVPEPASNGSQVTTDLSGAGIAVVSKTATTQFKIRFETEDNDDAGGDSINFASSNHGTSGYRPVLEIEYTD